MKKITLVILVFVITTSSNLMCQITIQSTTVYPVGMDKNINISNDLSTSNPIFVDDIADGPNAVWNFSNLTTDFSRNLKVVFPHQSPFGAVIAANKVLLMDNGTIDSHYMISSSGQLVSNGHINGTGIKSEKTPTEVLLKFPATYQQFEQNTYTDRIKFYIGMPLQTSYVVDSVRTISTVELTYLIDGWGTLTTPAGTFNVLRQQVYKATNSVSDFLRADTNQWVIGAETSTTAERYFVFWSNSQNLPVLQLRDIGDGGFINDIYWLANPTLSNDDFTTKKFSISPNPFTDEFEININDVSEAVVEVFESTGRKIKSVKINSGVSNINLSKFQSGMYLVNVKTNDSSQTFKLIKR